jgi:hypothetical protein
MPNTITKARTATNLVAIDYSITLRHSLTPIIESGKKNGDCNLQPSGNCIESGQKNGDCSGNPVEMA